MILKINEGVTSYLYESTYKIEIMSVGNPKKFKKLEKFKEVLKEEQKEELSRVYKDKNHEVKKALGFKTDKDKSKLT
ncbi:hypothetical protein [Flagellimonas pacifica]|uniref:Uncharacterized protein n=1 Tax=Flagellimonas pacifica TaxID=1247520 RepID=A0A285MDZ6_9FLAO|nr:hypothetical protein [Allomuricauda parva]SNY95359.1 hypothetical protein SAMN06265377_1027 [Allomuricauda parva]